MAVQKVNIAGVELDLSLDEAGFRHAAATVGPRLGARRIGASLYEAEPGAPIWPYHYHHGVEEWLLSTTGLPANVCFPDTGRWLLRNGPDQDGIVLRD